MAPGSAVPVSRLGLPDLGFGIGLRGPHIAEICRTLPPVGWLEVITDNALIHQGWLRARLRQLRAHYPLVLHGVGLGVAGPQPLDREYIRKIKELADELEVAWVSDHLAWTALPVRGRGAPLQSHDLLPVPYTGAVLAWTAARVQQVQELLGRPLVLENPSTYMQLRISQHAEWDFVAALARTTGCGLLLDLNNIHVSAANHGWDPAAWLDAVPWPHVVQVHVAGPRDRGTHLLDTHEGPVPAEVWALYREARRRGGPCATLLEWDANLPGLDGLLAAVGQARAEAAEADRTPRALAWPVQPAAAVTVSRAPRRLPSRTQALYRSLFLAITGHDAAAAPGPAPESLPCPAPESLPAPGAALAGTSNAGGQGASHWALAGVRAGGALAAAARVAVHREMYVARLTAALEEDFPCLQAALGVTAWQRLVAAVLARYPSRHWALERYSAVVPPALVQHARAWGLPRWSADLAALEWARIQSWLAAAEPPLDPARLQAALATPGAPLRLRCSAATVLVEVAAKAWSAASGGQAPRVLLVGGSTAKVTVRVSRAPDWRRSEAAMHPDEAWLLRMVDRGRPLLSALSALAHRAPHSLPQAGRWLEGWARDGVVVHADGAPAPAGASPPGG